MNKKIIIGAGRDLGFVLITHLKACTCVKLQAGAQRGPWPCGMVPRSMGLAFPSAVIFLWQSYQRQQKFGAQCSWSHGGAGSKGGAARAPQGPSTRGRAAAGGVVKL